MSNGLSTWEQIKFVGALAQERGVGVAWRVATSDDPVAAAVAEAQKGKSAERRAYEERYKISEAANDEKIEQIKARKAKEKGKQPRKLVPKETEKQTVKEKKKQTREEAKENKKKARAKAHAKRVANAKPSKRKRDIEKCQKCCRTDPPTIAGVPAGEAFRPVPEKDPKYQKCLREATVKRQYARSRRKRKAETEKEKRLNNFDEQAYLLDNLRWIVNVGREHTNVSVENQEKFSESLSRHNYRYFLQLEDDEPRITKNKLVGLGLSALNNLTTAQLSGLIPQLRLFKAVSGGEKTVTTEFPFNKFTTMDSIVKSEQGRGVDVGLLKVDWKDTGGQPWTSGKSFEGTMVLHFQSLEAIFKNRTVNGQSISFADLMDKAGTKNYDPQGLAEKNCEHKGVKCNEENRIERARDAKEQKRADAFEAAETNQVEGLGLCLDNETKIILEAGWSIADATALNLTKRDDDGKTIVDQLGDMRRRYILEIWRSEIAVTDNGEVDVTLSFSAWIEGMALSTQSDILNIEDSNFKNLSPQLQTLIKEAEQTSRDLGANQTKAKELLKKQKEDKKAGKKDTSKKLLDELRNQKKDLDEKYKRQKSNLDLEAYRKIFSLMTYSLGDKTSKAGGRTSSRVFYVDLSEKAKDLYTELLELQATKGDISRGVALKAEKALIEKYLNERETKKGQLTSEGQKFGNNWWINFVDNFGTGTAGEKSDDAKAELKKMNKMIKDKQASKTAQGYVQLVGQNNDLRIQYVFLGDIIEAVMSIIYEPRQLIGNKPGAKIGTTCKFLRKGLKLLMGCVTIIDPWTLEERNMPLADIPVSLNYFKAFWFDNVVGKNLKRYTLLPFLKDLCGKLVSNAMAPKRFGGTPGYQLSFKTDRVVLREGNPLDQKWNKGVVSSPKERININEAFPGGGLSKTPGKQNAYSEWLYVYADGNPRTVRSKSSWQPLGYFEDQGKKSLGDKSVNIPHFIVGADKGIIKNIKFQKNKIPGRFEMALEQAKAKQDRRVRSNLMFQDMYNADITLFGNPAFKNGQWVYLDARSMGVTPGSENLSRLNIGGYYRVYEIQNRAGPGEFTTTLKSVQELGMAQIWAARQRKK